MAKIKKAKDGIKSSPRASADNTRVSKRDYVTEGKVKDRQAKDANDIKKMKGKYTSVAFRDREGLIPSDSIRFFPGQRTRLGVPYIRDLGMLKGMSDVSDKELLEGVKKGKARQYQDTPSVKANKFMNQKNGGKIKKVMKSGDKMKSYSKPISRTAKKKK